MAEQEEDDLALDEKTFTLPSLPASGENISSGHRFTKADREQFDGLHGPDSLISTAPSGLYSAPPGSYGQGQSTNGEVDSQPVVKQNSHSHPDIIPKFESLLPSDSASPQSNVNNIENDENSERQTPTNSPSPPFTTADLSLKAVRPIMYTSERILEIGANLERSLDIWERDYRQSVVDSFPEICRSQQPHTGMEPDVMQGRPSLELTLRPYQEDFVKRSLMGDNDVILLPTGSGKTFVAIKVILEHLKSHSAGRVKVVFFVPTVDLANQQYKVIRAFLPEQWRSKCKKITGEEKLSPEMVKDNVKGSAFDILVVTPAIITNYFKTSEEAAITDFTLLVFDESHHTAKKHPYNMMLSRYTRALRQPADLSISSTPLPQVLAMTATVGIGNSATPQEARDYILDLCCKFDLKSPPCREEIGFLVSDYYTSPSEEYIEVKRLESNALSNFIESQLMEPLEQEIIGKLTSDIFRGICDDLKEFPSDRMSQVYQQFVTNMQTFVEKLPPNPQLKEDRQWCNVALLFLQEYYMSLLIISLVNCECSVGYLEKTLIDDPQYKAVHYVLEMFKGNLEVLHNMQQMEDEKNKNEKVVKLLSRLEDLFCSKVDSKVIIFVERRLIAKYLAELINELGSPALKAKEFTSKGHSLLETGMSSQQRVDIRAKFEGEKYNILVATSVAEEGIDIQSCNMVVRYMYVKDMIAKIQSRGRARHAEGVLLTIYDDRLRRQEEKNDFKEKLMVEALKYIKEMSDEAFLTDMEARLARLTFPPEPSEEDEEVLTRPDGVEICCSMCSSFLGHLSDVRVFMETHHLVMDGSIQDRVKANMWKYPRDRYDGMSDTGRLNCLFINKAGDECGTKVAVLRKMSSGLSFAMWNVERITLQAGDKMITVSKYKDIKELYHLRPISLEELERIGGNCQFDLH